MNNHRKIEIVECPRDAMQGWPKLISTKQKVRYLNALIKVGFDTIDSSSFVHPGKVPQMADTADVLEQLDTKDLHPNTRLLVLVGSYSYALAAVPFENVAILGYPFSVSPEFLKRNLNRTPEEALGDISRIKNLCEREGKSLVVYLSMAFGNPYGEAYDLEKVLEWIRFLEERGIQQIAIADTTAMANATSIKEMGALVLSAERKASISIHLHALPEENRQLCTASLDAGWTRLESTLGGVGGCPFAQDHLIGNLDTFVLLDVLAAKGKSPNLDLDALSNARQIAGEIFV